ncbi:MAG: type II secretion system protein [Nitrospirae bacterium]|nr:type II secretion system protein [Magnetococcales bacterium]
MPVIGKQLANRGGWTLLELMLALGIMVLLITAASVRYGENDRESMRRAAVQFRNVLEWVSARALFSKTTYRLVFDLVENGYRCEKMENGRFVSVKDTLVLPVVINPIQGRMVWVGRDERTLRDRDSTVQFDAFGPDWPVLVQFVAVSGNGFTVSLRPEWSRSKMFEGLLGWREVERAG